MSNRHYSDLPMHLFDPPAPPELMKLSIGRIEDNLPERVFHDVVESSLAGPSVFRFMTLDGKIRLFDMAGRDFVLTPQVPDDV